MTGRDIAVSWIANGILGAVLMKGSVPWVCDHNNPGYLFCSNAQHNVLNWQHHAARRMILHYLEVDAFYQVGINGEFNREYRTISKLVRLDGYRHFTITTGYIQVVLSLLMQMHPLMQNLCTRVCKMYFLTLVQKTHFHIKGCAPNLALEKLPKLTQYKWLIILTDVKWLKNFTVKDNNIVCIFPCLAWP